MTAYCEKCGNQLRDSAKFCHSCGAAAANIEPQSSSYSPGSAPSRPPASYSAPPRSSYSPQPPPNYPQGWQASNVEVPKKSSGIGKIIVIALLVIFMIGRSFCRGGVLRTSQGSPYRARCKWQSGSINPGTRRKRQDRSPHTD